MNKENLTDNHIKFINLNPWINDINFNNVDIIECEEFWFYEFIRSLIEYKVIQCNILINYNKDRFYHNGKHYFTKIRYVSENNKIIDILRDSEGNRIFRCEDKYDWWGDRKFNFHLCNDFTIEYVNKEDLIITYIKDNE